MKSHEKTILIYGLTTQQKLTLGILCRQAGVRLRIVTDGLTTLTIRQLLEQEEPAEGISYPVGGRFALLDGFQGREHEAAALINQAAPGVIKAAHTAHNSQWRFCDLCSAIHLEHQTMSGR